MSDTFSISIIIPVINESRAINQTIDALFSQKAPPIPEIIVVDGDLAGRTIQAITHPLPIKLISSPGRGIQMNHGAKHASGNILLFLHADTILPPNAFDHIKNALNHKDTVAGAFELGIQSPKKKYRIIEKGAAFRTRLTKIPYGDQAFFMKRDFFHQIGGFKALPLMEDIELIHRMNKLNYKIQILPHKVLTSPRRWEKDGAFYGTLRNWTLAILFFLGVSPYRLKKFY